MVILSVVCEWIGLKRKYAKRQRACKNDRCMSVSWLWKRRRQKWEIFLRLNRRTWCLSPFYSHSTCHSDLSVSESFLLFPPNGNNPFLLQNIQYILLLPFLQWLFIIITSPANVYWTVFFCFVLGGWEVFWSGTLC